MDTTTTGPHARAEELRAELERDLRDRIEQGHPDMILLALHTACGAFALGITGPIDPAPSTAQEP